MKTQFPRRLQQSPHLLSASLMAFVMFFLLPGFSNAQNFVPSVLTEYTYPPLPGPVNTTTHSFTYTMSHIGGMTNKPTPPPPPPAVPSPYMPYPPTVPLSDLTVHSWDDGPGVVGGIAYLNTANGAGTPPPVPMIYDQGFIPYPATARDIEVSLMQDQMGYAMLVNGTNAAWYVIVSYYNANPLNPGHFVDVYIWNQPPPNGPGGLTLQFTKQLSGITSYTRISQGNGHNTYGFCITWEAPGAGIDFVYGFMNSTALPAGGPFISPVYTLAGTVGQTHPDVAFTHTGAGLNLQFVYYKTVGHNVVITESTTPMVLGPAWPPVLPNPVPVVNDVNTIPFPCTLTDLKTRIDAPDHYACDEWAYSYILPMPCGAANTDIYVRYHNCTATTTITYDVNSGAMGNVACNVLPSGINDWPVCSFDATTMPTLELNVEWYTQYQSPLETPVAPAFFMPPANIGGYVGVRMNNAGGLVSGLDYLQVAAPGSNTLASLTPTIASSRQNDRTDYQFVAFANKPAGGGAGNVMIVKDRVWGAATFKGGQPANYWSSLYKAVDVPAVPNEENSVTAYPNPFTDKISLSISAGLLDKMLTVSIEDEMGRVVNSFTAPGNTVNTKVGDITGQLGDGFYFVKIQSGTNDFNNVIKIQKLATH